MRVNGTVVDGDWPIATALLDVLRGAMGLTGTKEACGVGECGACTVLIDGRPALACITLAARLGDATVETIEGLADEAAPLRRALAEHGGVQCAFCTPGQVVSAVAMNRGGAETSERAIRHVLSGNICRCTGYDGIIAAVRHAAQAGR